MRDVKGVDVHGDRVWAASFGGMFSFNINNSSSIEKYTTLNGLFTNQLTAIKTDNNSSQVFIGSDDGGISVYDPVSGQWKYANDIKVSGEPSKRINHFFQYGNNMFISAEFGVIKFNVSQFQFVDQPYIFLGPEFPPKTAAKETYVVNDTVWVATFNGIAYANVNANLPIQSNWRNYTIYNSALVSSNVYSITYFDNRVFFGTDSSMVYHQNGQLERYYPVYNGNTLYLPVIKTASSSNAMYFATGAGDNKVYKVTPSTYNDVQLIMENVIVTSMDISDDGRLVVGTSNAGVVIEGGASTYPNGPHSNLFFSMSVDWDENLWVATGSEGFYKFDKITSLWENYTVDKYPAIRSNNFKHILASKFRNVIYASNFGEGLLIKDGDSLAMYDETNSILRPLQGSTEFVVCEGLAEDQAGNLWVINRGYEYSMVNFTAQLSYLSPENPNQYSMINITVDNYNTKWVNYPSDVTGSEHGIAYLNENNPYSQKIIRDNELGSEVNNANDVVVDMNGEVWVATDNGVVIIPDPFQVIANPNSIPAMTKMRIIENGLATPLTENVTTIAVDALNNKWLGTYSSGVIYVSADGSTILQQFNTSNSPIPDNNISSIAIDNKSGRIYFGTQKGAASYMSVAIEPLEECDKLTAGPNPFIIPNENKLRIDGLVEGSSIKILSINGSLIAEFDSPGGRVGLWDGRDLNGSYVPSGIYIIVGYNEDGSKVCTGKVAVVRK
jgi:ligand-binding sensor domain-containing protein